MKLAVTVDLAALVEAKLTSLVLGGCPGNKYRYLCMALNTSISFFDMALSVSPVISTGSNRESSDCLSDLVAKRNVDTLLLPFFAIIQNH